MEYMGNCNAVGSIGSDASGSRYNHAIMQGLSVADILE